MFSRYRLLLCSKENLADGIFIKYLSLHCKDFLNGNFSPSVIIISAVEVSIFLTVPVIQIYSPPSFFSSGLKKVIEILGCK